MIVMFLLFGAATAWLYTLYSRRVGSFVNAITIFTVFKIVVEFILEPLTYLLGLFTYDFTSIFIIYLISFIGYAAFISGLLIAKRPVRPPGRSSHPSYALVAWLLLAGAWALYAPVLIEFRYLLTEPRRIYELTRTGYGIYTFGSALLSFLAYIVFLMSSQRKALLFYIPLLTLMILKGTKGQFFILAGIFVVAKVYLDGYKYTITRSAAYGAVAAVALLYLFAFTYRGNIDNIFVTVAEYSDYNRNGALVLQDNTFGHYEGQLSAETLWIPKIPRALWPNKPKIFGEFRLAVQYYPEWFLQDQGAPSFGLGFYIADFGWLTFLIVPLIQFLCGYWLGVCLNRLVITPNAFYFVMSVYLSGSNLLASGGGFYIVEHILIGLGLATMLAVVNAFAKGGSSPPDGAALRSFDADRRATG